MSMAVRSKRHLLIMVGIIVAVVGSCLLYFFNPETTAQYPRCPFYALTGLKCPGCGTLRGLHALMHFRFIDAWRVNPAMVVSIPLIISLLISPKLCKNVIVGKVIVTVVLIWWVARNF